MGAVAMGIDGLIVEVHHDPIMSLTDSRQAITPKQLESLVSGVREQRHLYLEQKETRDSFYDGNIPQHIDVFFRKNDINSLGNINFDTELKDYYDSDSGISTARIPVGELGKFRQNGWAIGKIAKYMGRDRKEYVEGIHVTMPSGEKIQISPYNEGALNFRKTPTISFDSSADRRVELAHGFANRVVQDAYLTIDMGKLPELKSVPFVIYRKVEED